MVRFAKGTARVLIEDPPDPMTVNYRERCVVRGVAHDRIYYGITAKEYNNELAPVPSSDEAYLNEFGARNVRDDFDHSAGRGLLPGRRSTPPTTPHFFTAGIGRAEEVKLRQKLRRL